MHSITDKMLTEQVSELGYDELIPAKLIKQVNYNCATSTAVSVDTLPPKPNGIMHDTRLLNLTIIHRISDFYVCYLIKSAPCRESARDAPCSWGTRGPGS